MVGWFEIPTIDLDRAIKFYESVFEVKLDKQKFGDLDMAFFPWFEGGNGCSGALVCEPNYYAPQANGLMIYFTARSGNIEIELERIAQSGGKIALPKTLINEEIGYMAIFFDTEGNRVALHSRT
jgi:predicted enzyme related to lactoylglutathione lyase